MQRALLWFSSRGNSSSSDWPEIKKYLEDGYQVISFDFRALGENQMLYQANYRKIDYSSLTREDIDRHYKDPILGVLANYVYNSLLIGRPYFLQMIEDAEIVWRFVNDKLGAQDISLTASRDAYTLAYRIAEVIPKISLLTQQEEIIQWSEIVEEKREIWPIEYLLPGGAYIR